LLYYPQRTRLKTAERRCKMCAKRKLSELLKESPDVKSARKNYRKTEQVIQK